MANMTVEQKRERIAEEIRKFAEDKRQELALLRQLPGDLPVPTVSNIRAGCATWVSFHMPNSMGEHIARISFSIDLLKRIEAAGFTPVPATLAKYGMYRPSVHPGLQEELPERYSNQGLDWCEPIAPLWITPQQYTQAEATVFYCAPDGALLRIICPMSSMVGISAVREEYQGNWSYIRGSAKLRFPQSWHSVTDQDDGTPVTQISNHSQAYVDSEKGISGSIYFTPLEEPFPLTPAEFLQRLDAQA